MEPTKFPKRPTMRWDPYKRQVLCCLYRFFTCNKKQTAEIFSYMFRSHLKQRGIQGFVPFATLNTQWIWMRNKRDPVWLRVHINTAFETSGEWGEIITKIKSAAKTLRFELHEKMEDDTHPSRCGPLVPDAEQNIASVSDLEHVQSACKLTIYSPSMDPLCQCFPNHCLLRRLSLQYHCCPRARTKPSKEDTERTKAPIRASTRASVRRTTFTLISPIDPTDLPSRWSLATESCASGVSMKELSTSPRTSRNCKTKTTITTVNMRSIVMAISIMTDKTILV